MWTAGGRNGNQDCTHVVTYGSWRTVFEASALVAAAGVNPAKLAEVIETADPEGATLLLLLRLHGPDGKLPEGASVRHMETLMTKDLEAARDLAATLGVDIPLTDVTLASAHQTLGLDEELPPLQGDRRQRGLEMMDRVYGAEFGRTMRRIMPEMNTPLSDQTVEHLFAEIWSRPNLSIRDRRLLVMGVTAALGWADLLQIQVGGALVNHELTAEQLQEVVLHLAYYVGWGNANAVQQGINAALAAHTLKEKETRAK